MSIRTTDRIQVLEQPRERGSTLLLSLFAMTLLAALALGQFSMVQKNFQQSSFYNLRTELREYAESGVALAVHDLRYGVSGNEGSIGTVHWTAADDLGVDGVLGTADDGEGDGVPTIGEPTVVPVAVGPAARNVGLAVHADTAAFAGAVRVVSEARSGDDRVAVEAYVTYRTIYLPRTPPLLVLPGCNLALGGSSFSCDGNDTNLDGSRGSEPAMHGVGTPQGASAGDHTAALLSGIDPHHYSQFTGIDGSPSVGEVPGIDPDAFFTYLASIHTHKLPAGNYTSITDLGDAQDGDFRIVHVTGDLKLSGQYNGAGVLLVDGDLDMSGQSRYDGLIIARGDVTLSGGGSGTHIYGSLWALGTNVKIGGNSALGYSSEAYGASDGTAEAASHEVAFSREL